MFLSSSCLQVLATDRNSGIEYEYWLPPDQYDLYHGRRSPLRQAHQSASYFPWNHPTTSTTVTTTTPRPPPNTPKPHWCKTHSQLLQSSELSFSKEAYLQSCKQAAICNFYSFKFCVVRMSQVSAEVMQSDLLVFF